VPGLEPGPGDRVGTRRGSTVLAGLLLFPGGPQVEVVLQQQPQDLPSPLVQELFQLAGREHGSGRAGELGGQPVEHSSRHGERIVRRNCPSGNGIAFRTVSGMAATRARAASSTRESSAGRAASPSRRA
jgi:hypothetical protein